MKAEFILIAALLISSCVTAFADDEAANLPVVKSSEYGTVYAKSVPEEGYGQKGKTRVFGVGADRDTLICEYDWYENQIYIGGAGESTLIRFGPWHRGAKPQNDHLALGIYRNGKAVREYSTADMERLGSGVSESVSHYTIFQRHLGFRWLKADSYVYEFEGISGKVFTFDLEMGTVVEMMTEPPAGGNAKSRTPQP